MLVTLKVLTLNCWGIPWVSRDKTARIKAIGEFLASNDYDIICLQEVWTQGDYDRLRKSCEQRLPHAHYFHSGVMGSGICVLSRYPLLAAFFHAWPLNGYAHKIHHGDWWAGKGVGLCRILVASHLVHIYTAHMHAEYDRDKDEYLAHRILQAWDTAQFVRLTAAGADAIIFAGDFNSEPEDLAFCMLRDAAGLHDACPCDKQYWTNEAPGNTYSPAAGTARPKRIDYVLYGGRVRALLYEQPMPTCVPTALYSYSDHEAICATLEVGSPLKLTPQLPECQNSLKDGLRVLKDAEVNLNARRRMYICAFLVLLGALWVTESTEHGSLPSPFHLLPTAAFRMLRLTVSLLALFALLMATLWDRIESNAVRAASYSMCLQLNQAQCSTNS